MITRRRRTSILFTWLKNGIVPLLLILTFILIKDFYFQNNCTDTSNLNKATLSRDIRKGIPIGYIKENYFDGNTVTVELTSDDLKRIKSDSTALNKVFIDKLKTILSKNRANFEEMNINPDILFVRQEEAYQKNQLINNDYDIGSIIEPVLRYEDDIGSGIKIKTPQGFEFEVSNDCSVKSSFQVNIRKRPLEDKFLSELEGRINNNKVMSEYLNRVSHNPMNCPFDMCAIAQLIKGDRGFQREIENLCRENQNFLSLFRSNNNFTNDCFNQFFFSRSQYAIENIYKIFIKSYVNSLRRYFKQHPNESFEILCQGYTDPTNVFSGIPLSEKVYYDETNNNKINLSNPTYKYIGNTITDNNQLSYVRAFSGINKIRDELQAYPSIFKNLHFYYQGMGSIEQGNDECSRKIQFNISRIN